MHDRQRAGTQEGEALLFSDGIGGKFAKFFVVRNAKRYFEILRQLDKLFYVPAEIVGFKFESLR